MSRSIFLALVATAACNGAVSEPADPIEPPPPPVCDEAVVSVGASPMLRLTREQYDNTIRDLLGIDDHPSASLQADEENGAFRVNAVAPVGRVVAEQYMLAAEDLAARATVDLDALVGCDFRAVGVEACAAQFVDRFGRRAYRRPLTSDETAAYRTLFAEFQTDVRFAIQVVVQAMLQSPNFLYRPELVPEGRGDGEIIALGPYELASRLSYYLWASMPDDALLDAAAAGELATPEGLRAQAERMLADAKAADAIGSFHAQWLTVDELDRVEKDPVVFPEWNARLRSSMANETRLFADHVIRQGDGRLSTLLTGPFTFVDAQTAPIYGVAADGRVDLDPAQRAGLLTQPGVLAATSHNVETSPTLRGRLVRELFFCQPLLDPPADVDTTLPPVEPGSTRRERLSIHMEGAVCAGCHRLTDPIGFGFEVFDAIGRYRTTENGRAIDPSVELVSTDIDGSYADAVELAHAMAESDTVARCVAKQWFQFALSRPVTPADACASRSLEDLLVETDDVRALMLAIVASDAFRMQRL